MKRASFGLQIISGVCIVFACLSFMGLVVSMSTPKLFDRYFSALLLLNIVNTTVMMFIVGGMCIKLSRNLHLKEFGSRLTAKLALTMASIALVPTLILFTISSTFISRSSNDWFGKQVENALDAGVNITQGILARQQKLTQQFAKDVAESLSSTPPSMMMSDLLKKLENHPGTEALVLTSTGTAIAAAGSKINVLLPDLPSTIQLKTARTAGLYSVVDGDTLFETHEKTADHSTDLRIRVIVPIPVIKNYDIEPFTSSLLPRDRTHTLPQLFLQIVQPIEENVAINATKIVDGYREYQQTTYARDSMQTLYWTVLTLTLLLTVFASIAAALAFARRTTGPVLQLAIGTKQVADGHLAKITEFTGSDEINTLTRSFNTMVKQVSDARLNLDKQRQQAEQAQAFLERVLSNISSGVLVIDPWNTVVTANLAAQRILGKQTTAIGASLNLTDPDFASAISKAKEQILNTSDITTLEFELHHNNKIVPLYIRLTSMALGAQVGSVLVFDDLTQLIQAQRTNAWGEVARRLAHEIKNPLTPILLSAERLEWKLSKKITDEKDLALLHKTITTITTQVNALKQMVNDFREFAKLPPAILVPIDLSILLQEISTLYHNAGVDLTLRIKSPLPAVAADIVQLRQVFNNLISNSIEASGGPDKAHITITAEPQTTITCYKSLDTVKLSIVDNGSGFSEKVLQSAFEPYVTTKPTGTGLGLPMVKKILDDHGADISLQNCHGTDGNSINGALVEITLRATTKPKTENEHVET